MVRLARKEVFDPDEVAIAHVYSRVVRRCFLMGHDPLSGKNYDHRKVWIEKDLQRFAAAFGIDLLGYAILSNHFHLILRSRPDVVATWDDTEVARRWLMLCPHRRLPDGTPAEPTEAELNQIRRCPVRRDTIRRRLSSISWWMRLLCQRVAMRANREDEQSGRFWQDRYKAVRLLDEASLLACSAYVDLNPIRAAIAETLRQSDHTSIQRRIEAVDPRPGGESDSRGPAGGSGGRDTCDAGTARGGSRRAAWLAPLSIDEASDPSGPCASESGERCSDKGFLPMSLGDYVELLEWTAGQMRPGQRSAAAEGVPKAIDSLGLEAAAWSELVRDFGRLFLTVAGRPRCVDAARSYHTGRRFHLRRRARELLSMSC